LRTARHWRMFMSCLSERSSRILGASGHCKGDSRAFAHRTPGPNGHKESTIITKAEHDYRYYSIDGSCCDLNTVFEVVENGETMYFRNMQSTSTVTGSQFSFRNPPDFNSLISAEYCIQWQSHRQKLSLCCSICFTTRTQHPLW